MQAGVTSQPVCRVPLLTEKCSHRLTAATSRWMEEPFLEQEIKSGSTSCYKNTHRATLPTEITSIRPEITWWTLTLFAELFCCVNCCRTDLWHRTTDLEWDLEHWTTFYLQETRARSTLTLFHSQKSALSQLKTPTASLCLVCYSSFPSMNQVHWKLISQKKAPLKPISQKILPQC